ncbi:MAG: hypothetical protein LVR00_04750 [Rhabdochlamydiaceae bacterium]|jgi:hypothetical protein
MGVDPINSPGYNSSPGGKTENWGKGVMPPGKPLPADSTWVKSLRRLFPHASEAEIMEYASRFRDNMFTAVQDQIKHDAKKQKEAADRLKRVAQGQDD